METERQLALIIKEAREKAGYTQEKLSLKIGKSDSNFAPRFWCGSSR